MYKLQNDGFTAIILEPHDNNAKRLSQNIVQIMQMLQLYQAEIACILGLRCADVAALAHSRYEIEAGSVVWERALLLVRLYEILHADCRGDGTAMYHWLHRDLSGFDAAPHRLLVDKGLLKDVVDFLEKSRRTDYSSGDISSYR